jgi:hypothetical protein
MPALGVEDLREGREVSVLGRNNVHHRHEDTKDYYGEG